MKSHHALYMGYGSTWYIHFFFTLLWRMLGRHLSVMGKGASITGSLLALDTNVKANTNMSCASLYISLYTPYFWHHLSFLFITFMEFLLHWQSAILWFLVPFLSCTLAQYFSFLVFLFLSVTSAMVTYLLWILLLGLLITISFYLFLKWLLKMFISCSFDFISLQSRSSSCCSSSSSACSNCMSRSKSVYKQFCWHSLLSHWVCASPTITRVSRMISWDMTALRS